MSAFEFSAMDAAGKERKGVMEGDNARQIRQLLRDKGWMPLNVVEVREKEARSQGNKVSFSRGVSAIDLSLMTRQLATLVQAGMPVEEALRAVSQQLDKPRLKSMIMSVRSRVMEGHSLATALNDFPHVFNDLFRTTVEAGEHSGHLNVVLERLADYTESRQQMNQKLMLALLYPIIVTCIAVGVISLLMVYVVPKVVEMFEYLGQDLPLLTRILIVATDFINNWGLAVLILLGVGVVGASYALRNEQIRYRWHLLVLKLPVFSRLMRGMETGRFARTFSILTASGVPVLEGMRISAQVIKNLPMREAVLEAARRVREGGGLSQALGASGYFPPIALHLIGSGESSGNLEDMLDRAATTQEREVENATAAMVGIMEPMTIVVMGVIVLMIVLAIMLPILDMNQLAQ